MKHLWEIKHPYYCNEANYFSNETVCRYDSFDEFMGYSHGELNPCANEECHDLNLIFRWDWIVDYDDDDDHIEGTDELYLFYMGQRKGLFRTVIIKVTKEDEPRVIEFLKPRWAKMAELWEGISDIEFLKPRWDKTIKMWAGISDLEGA